MPRASALSPSSSGSPSSASSLGGSRVAALVESSPAGFATPEEALTDEFYRWELRGRGWQVWDVPVLPEPPFRPFYGHTLPAIPQRPLDDARKPTFFGSLVERFRDRVTSRTALAPAQLPDVDEPLPDEATS